MKRLLHFLYFSQLRTRQWFTALAYRVRNRLWGGGPDTAPPPKDPPRKLLVVIRALIGDSIMCFPVLEEARRLWPDAHITVLAEKPTCELLQACPHIDALRALDAVPFALFGRHSLGKLRIWMERESFDLVLLLMGADFALLLAAVGIPVRVGMRSSLLGPCLTHTYTCATARTWGPYDQLNALRVFGLGVRNKLPVIFLSRAARAAAQSKLRAGGLQEGVRYAILHPFGSLERKWWPLREAPEAARRMAARFGWRTLLVGGPETRNAILPPSPHILDFRGVFDLQELCAAMQGADVVVSTDSGPFHMAAALGRPLIGLFPAVRPEHAARYQKTRIAFGYDPSCEGRCHFTYCRSVPCRQLSALKTEEVMLQLELLTDEGSFAVPPERRESARGNQ